MLWTPSRALVCAFSLMLVVPPAASPAARPAASPAARPAGSPAARPTAGKPGGSKARASTVLVRSTTQGARIFIDGEVLGTVPLKLPVALAPGTHTIKVSKPGHADYLDTFELKRGQELLLEVDLLALAGVLQINATAPQAIVAVDQRQIGEVPFEGEIPPGEHVLEVRAPGHSTFRKALSIVAGEQYRFDVTLVPMAEGSEEAGATPWYGHWWVWAGAAVVVAGGVTAGILLSREEAEATPRNQLPITLTDR